MAAEIDDKTLCELVDIVRSFRAATPDTIHFSTSRIIDPVLAGDILDRDLHVALEQLKQLDAVFFVTELLKRPRQRRMMLYIAGWVPLSIEADLGLERRLRALGTCAACKTFLINQCALHCICTALHVDQVTGAGGCPLCTGVCIYDSSIAGMLTVVTKGIGPPTGEHERYAKR